MCGIAGFIDLKAITGPDLLDAAARAMAATLIHRGPDASGVWCDAEAGLALAHTRLSIVDLTAAGAQPMTSASKRFVMVYNGEIYNADELRGELGGSGFRGHSDSEVLLEACARWGIEQATQKLIGMFAFALWDRETRTLSLVRDRLGIKPLYWGSRGGHFFFASELKALMAHPAFERAIDANALASYLRFNYMPGPHTLFRGVHKLQPGTILTLRPGGEPEISTYWSLRQIATDGQKTPARLSDAEAEEQLDRLVLDAVRRRMVADVPLGAFLSGGIDSSVVVAAMQAESNARNAGPVHTFTIGMDVPGYNEAEAAKAIAGHLGTDHSELYVTADDALAVIPDLARFYDEPFADSSQIPTYLVARLARGSVTVALSGDGGDELFAGYARHHWAEKLARTTGAIPRSLKRLGAGLLGALPLNPDGALGIKANKARDILSLNNATELYRRQLTVWENPDTLVPGASEYAGIPWDRTLETDIPDLLTRTQLVDGLTYLPDDILTKVDRASMAVSLEARVPLLDHRIVEFAFRLPKHQRKRNGEGKWLLKNVLARRVPRQLFERPKMGFGIPVGQWLRGPLKDWAEDLLSENSLATDGLLNPVPIRQVWAAHLAGRPGLTEHLWTVLMFQAWRQEWRV